MHLRWLITSLIALALVSGCNRQQAKPEVETPPPPLPVVTPQPVPTPSPRKVKKRPAPPPPPLLILVSEALPAYQQVADELVKQFPKRSTVVQLSTRRAERKQITALLKKPGYQQYVAIGLAAAKEARAVVDKEDEVIFCQVFNYQDHQLVGPRYKGVGALPGTATMFARWRELSPTLKSVAVISGPGLEAEIEKAISQAAKHGIALQHEVVNTDKELLFAYKQMATSVQGLWLLPDNRVLSGRTIKELMSFSVRNAKQVAVFSDSILRLGGLLSVTTRPEEIAAKVAQRLRKAHEEKGVPGPVLLLLEDGDIQVNAIVARRYNPEYSKKIMD